MEIKLSFSGFLFIVFLVLKLTEVIDWSWWWITCPLWWWLALIIFLHLFSESMKGLNHKKYAKYKELKNRGMNEYFARKDSGLKKSIFQQRLEQMQKQNKYGTNKIR